MIKHLDTKSGRRLRMTAVLLLSLAILLICSSAPVSAASGVSSGAPSILSAIMDRFVLGSSKVAVRDVDYDRKDRELEFEFKGSVRWKSPKVTITSYNGSKTYKGTITDKDSNELEYKLKKSSKLTYGNYYKYKITGVRSSSGGSYQTVRGTFKAVDD